MGDANIGTRLKKAREKKGLTQVEACEKAGIPKTQTLSAYERGVNSLTAETLKTLSALYGVSSDWILYGSNVTKNENKTEAEQITELITAADSLGLKICEYDDGYGGTYYVMLLDNNSEDFTELMRDIYKLEAVKHFLETEDYLTLVKKRIALYVDANEDDDLPF